MTPPYRLMYQTLFDEALPSPVDEPGPQSATPTQETGNVIFIHPDGTTPAYFNFARLETEVQMVINWDRMTDAVYIIALKIS